MEEKLVFWEVLKLMAENPKRKAKCSGGEIEIRKGNLVWSNTGELMSVHYKATGRWNTLTEKEWTITEPPKELKKMSFGEATYELFQRDELTYKDIKSVISGLDADRNYSKIPKEEFLGLWTVKGIYEEVETNG